MLIKCGYKAAFINSKQPHLFYVSALVDERVATLKQKYSYIDDTRTDGCNTCHLAKHNLFLIVFLMLTRCLIFFILIFMDLVPFLISMIIDIFSLLMIILAILGST